MTFVHYLTSDGVSDALLLVGIPACLFLIAYSAKIWRAAVLETTPVRTLAYLLVASGGMAIYPFGDVIASQLSFMAAMATSPDDFGAAAVYTYAEAALLWPLGWAVLAGVALFIGGHRLGRPARSVLAALVAGFLTSLPALLVLMLFGVMAPNWFRILSFLQFLTVAVVIAAVASHQSRAQHLGQATCLPREVLD